jgi:hypothetical protein
MQPPIEPCRSGLTEAQVTYLLRDAPAITLGAGLELIDIDLNLIEDISDYLAGGSITRNSYADLHASASFEITRHLDWGAAIVRPYMTVSDGAITAQFYLGAFHTNTPAFDASESPPTFAVEATDILFRLSQPVGESYAINAGDLYLAVVEDILMSLGYSAYIIDQDANATAAPTSRVWALADNPTWLNVVNDLLSSVGYQGIWSDWNGRLRAERYILPQDRSIEWVYDDDPQTTMLGVKRSVAYDFFTAPNRWVFYRQNNVDDTAPVEGDGIYTYVNQSVGATSVDARGGLVITSVVSVDAADQPTLIAQAQSTIQSDMDIPTVITVETSPNPLHWHFDRLFISDSTAQLPAADVQCTEWTLTLPPDSGDMQQSWRVISQ